MPLQTNGSQDIRRRFVLIVSWPILREHHLRLPPDVSTRLELIPLQQGLTQDVRKPLLILWAGPSFGYSMTSPATRALRSHPTTTTRIPG